jgi:ATP-dependent RNA helicase DHX29
VVQLHSTTTPAEQRLAFAPAPPGALKVVLATNIAETSLTIEDVTVVIDTGRMKERRHDASRGMSSLVEDWVSAASAAQRRGRAGRVRAGTYLALYTQDRLEKRMKAHQAPEMTRLEAELNCHFRICNPIHYHYVVI